MGMFDYFAPSEKFKDEDLVQLKIGLCTLRVYVVGDHICDEYDKPIPDGMYRGSGASGWVVITDSIVREVSTSNDIPNWNLPTYSNYGEPLGDDSESEYD